MKSTLDLWLQGPMERIFPNDPMPEHTGDTWEIWAARGEIECFQVGVRTKGLNYLTAEAHELKQAEGAIISSDNIDLLYPDFVPVKWPTSDQSPEDVERIPPAFFPDPLVPDWELDVAGPEAPPTRSIWVRVRVPRDAQPGIYRGRLSVLGGRRNFKAENQAESTLFEKTGEVEFRLHVWDFVLPERSGLLMTNWFFPDQVADWYEKEMWSLEHWRLIEGIADNMAAHRQNVILTPFFGGREGKDQLVGVQKKGEAFSFDFGRLHRWCEIFMSRGFELIEGSHVAGGSRIPISFWQTGERGALKKVSFQDVQDPGFEAFLSQFFQALWAHMGEYGWHERYIQHISDEPKSEQLGNYRRLAEIIRKAAPGIKLMDALTDPEFAELVDHPVPLENTYQRIIEEADCPPENVWTYYCCGPTGPWPNRFIEYLLIRVRIFTWICFQKGIPGFLHWGYNFWNGIRKKRFNPWDDPTDHRHPGGDPLVVYPPRDDKMDTEEVIDSIRWEIIREAMEDYEYLTMTRELAEAGNSEARKILDEVAAKVVPDWTTHTRDWAYLNTLRERMGHLLSKTGEYR